MYYCSLLLGSKNLLDIPDNIWYNYIMNSKEFSLQIEKIVQERKGISHMDAVLRYCEQNDIDPSTVSPLLTKALKDKITIEAQNLNYIPKTGQLPV